MKMAHVLELFVTSDPFQFIFELLPRPFLPVAASRVRDRGPHAPRRPAHQVQGGCRQRQGRRVGLHAAAQVRRRMGMPVDAFYDGEKNVFAVLNARYLLIQNRRHLE